MSNAPFTETTTYSNKTLHDEYTMAALTGMLANPNYANGSTLRCRRSHDAGWLHLCGWCSGMEAAIGYH